MLTLLLRSVASIMKAAAVLMHLSKNNTNIPNELASQPNIGYLTWIRVIAIDNALTH